VCFNLKNSNFAPLKKRTVVEDKNYFKQFDIKLSTLIIGLHEFHFSINKSFFLKHPNEEIIDSHLDIQLKVNKKETMSLFTFILKGSITLQCDVCLEELEYPVDTEEELIVKVSSQESGRQEDENIVFISPNEQNYNVEQYIYEIIYAQIPMRKSHQDINQLCDNEMIEWIEKNANKQIEATDPRWEALKNIKLDK
jgi:uncharacterized metal-binding protein YceD (DUF177 family)